MVCYSKESLTSLESGHVIDAKIKTVLAELGILKDQEKNGAKTTTNVPINIAKGFNEGTRRQKRKNKSNRKSHRGSIIKCLLWNVEGKINAIKESPELDIFNDSDIICLTETMDYKGQYHHEGYYSFETLASKQDRGRPIGGIQILAKPHLGPKLIAQSDNYVLCKMVFGYVACFYFKPMTETDIIIEEITRLVTNLDGKIIVTGDFNCRVDDSGSRGIALVDACRELGLELINKTDDPTYICREGSSCIDLIFTNYKSKTVRKLYLDQHSHKKHLRVWSLWRIPTISQRSTKTKSKFSRSLDIPKFESLLEGECFKGTLEEIDKINQLLVESFTTTHRKRHKRWFDKECLEKKRELTKAKGTQEYFNIQRQYKKMLREKRTNFEEEQLLEKIRNSESAPWIMLSKARMFVNRINGSEWFSHFKSLFDIPWTCEAEINQNHEEDMWFNHPFTSDEIEDVFLSLKAKKAPGCDCIANEILQASYGLLASWWTSALNAALFEASIPGSWRLSKIKCLYKGKGEIEDPDSYRGIALISTELKVLTKLINNRLVTHSFSQIPLEQFGFVRARSCEMAISRFINDVEANREIKKMTYAVFVDFSKAFDSLDRMVLFEKLYDSGIKGRIYDLIVSILSENRIVIDNGVELSEPIVQRKGVLQGDSLSPSLFLFYVRELPTILQQCGVKCLMFADDLVIYSPDVCLLQRALEKLEEWCEINQLKVNINKTKAMKFRRGGGYGAKDFMRYKGEQVSYVSEFVYLGVNLQPSLCVTRHVQMRKEKTAKAIGLLRNLHRVSTKTLVKIYNIKVWPMMTYAFKPIASKLKTSDLLKMDGVKALLFKRALGLSKWTSNTFVFNLIGCDSMGEDVINAFEGIPESVIESYREERKARQERFVERGFMRGPAFNTTLWKEANQRNRNIITRYSYHGFHQEICINPNYHNINDDCVCKLCSSPIDDIYHLTNCLGLTKPSLTEAINSLLNC